jgi:phosphate transporter
VLQQTNHQKVRIESRFRSIFTARATNAAVASQNIELVSLEAGPSSSSSRVTQTTQSFKERVLPNTSSTTQRRTAIEINSGFVPHDDTASIHSGSQDHEGTGLLQSHSEDIKRVRSQKLNEKSSTASRPRILWAEALDKRNRESPLRYDPANMKFSHSLQFNSVPDWSAYYIAYDNLKKLYV